jgi:outer membrane protein W
MSVQSKLGAAAIAAASTIAAFGASAHDTAGFYANLYAGPSFLSSTNLTETRNAAGNVSGNASFDTGFGFGGAVGYRYGNGWAAELAWDYRSQGLKRVGGTTADGDFASNTFFVNGYYRFAKWGIVRPFVGAGVGWTEEIDIDINRNGRSLSYSRSGAVAVQGILGGEIDLSAKWSLVGDIRAMGVSSGSFSAENGNAGGTLSGDLEYRPVSLNIGLSYRF